MNTYNIEADNSFETLELFTAYLEELNEEENDHRWLSREHIQELRKDEIVRNLQSIKDKSWIKNEEIKKKTIKQFLLQTYLLHGNTIFTDRKGNRERACEHLDRINEIKLQKNFLSCLEIDEKICEYFSACKREKELEDEKGTCEASSLTSPSFAFKAQQLSKTSLNSTSIIESSRAEIKGKLRSPERNNGERHTDSMDDSRNSSCRTHKKFVNVKKQKNVGRKNFLSSDPKSSDKKFESSSKNKAKDSKNIPNIAKKIEKIDKSNVLMETKLNYSSVIKSPSGKQIFIQSKDRLGSLEKNVKFLDDEEKEPEQKVLTTNKTEERMETMNQTRYYTIEENKSLLTQPTRETIILKTEMSRYENVFGSPANLAGSARGAKPIHQKKLESPRQRILNKIESPVTQSMSPPVAVTEQKTINSPSIKMWENTSEQYSGSVIREEKKPYFSEDSSEILMSSNQGNNVSEDSILTKSFNCKTIDSTHMEKEKKIKVNVIQEEEYNIKVVCPKSEIFELPTQGIFKENIKDEELLFSLISPKKSDFEKMQKIINKNGNLSSHNRSRSDAKTSRTKNITENQSNKKNRKKSTELIKNLEINNEEMKARLTVFQRVSALLANENVPLETGEVRENDEQRESPRLRKEKVFSSEEIRNVEDIILKLNHSLTTSNGRLFPAATSQFIDQMQHYVLPLMSSKSKCERRKNEKGSDEEMDIKIKNLLSPEKRLVYMKINKLLKEQTQKIISKTISLVKSGPRNTWKLKLWLSIISLVANYDNRISLKNNKLLERNWDGVFNFLSQPGKVIKSLKELQEDIKSKALLSELITEFYELFNEFAIEFENIKINEFSEEEKNLSDFLIYLYAFTEFCSSSNLIIIKKTQRATLISDTSRKYLEELQTKKEKGALDETEPKSGFENDFGIDFKEWEKQIGDLEKNLKEKKREELKEIIIDNVMYARKVRNFHKEDLRSDYKSHKEESLKNAQIKKEKLVDDKLKSHLETLSKIEFIRNQKQTQDARFQKCNGLILEEQNENEFNDVPSCLPQKSVAKVSGQLKKKEFTDLKTQMDRNKSSERRNKEKEKAWSKAQELLTRQKFLLQKIEEAEKNKGKPKDVKN